ncbi:hypothetical protein EOB59_05490 [Mesorhizobium sp. M7A.F.Ca.MR.176.00.0.0]|uniref:hypothetical protein n=1 Tax=Mesorhizobium sp. M7A.F.Ca.MR.176.00.0.0 TaxID=2496776 RepID=UPI000FD5C3F1|nr:hypothetical protein [Mesorhizobium sp. M7A.F.Ca.MR.176.00.0.0]RUU92812.1 hypothetical protein EOB59_05490 [Mesorhizobium sp. M7A.F.Ca.MR.176.00.0.0]
MSRPVRGRWVFDDPTAPTVPQVPEVQTTLPTSAYGQTIPVVYGKCRLPAAYIWVPPILTVTSTHVEYWDTITSTTAKMSARLRFARPLVPNSNWTMRKLYANGKLIYDGSNGYRQSGLKFTAYDGRSIQPRDPTMVSEEGETNVSAHRGYLDIVVKDFDIVGLGAPPVFEAEWIQDGATTHDYDSFATLSSSTVDHMVPVWEQGLLYGYQEPSSIVRQFSIYAMREYFRQAQDEFSFLFAGWRYSRTLDLLFYLGQDGAGHWRPILTNAVSGIVATGANVGSVAAVIGTVCLVDTSAYAFYAGFTDDAQLFVYRADTGTIILAFDSGAAWNGYTKLECLVPGEVRGSEFDIWLCADTDLVKLTFTSQGTLKSSTVIATLSDDLCYVVYDAGGFLVVWTDAAHIVRINGATGAIVYNSTVPYQIETVGSRRLGDPDLQRLTDELYYVASSTSYFTNLDTGLTRSVAGATSNPQLFYYDGQTDTLLTKTPVFSVPQRLRIISEDGTQRLLSDFLLALMVSGGFDESEIAFEGDIDDVIDGAVVDVTAGVRDIARSVCEPYSIAIFERAGQIIFKRAFTGDALVIDAVLASVGDIADNP